MGRLISTGFLLVVIWGSGCTAELSRRHPPHHDDDSCPPCGSTDAAPDPGDFAFYFLVRQWGAEFCHKGCTRQPDANQFSLHGLWPNLDNACPKDFPEHCEKDGEVAPFAPNQLPDTTYNRMLKSWPSYKKSNECFWAHEWDCHGSCSGKSQPEYFKIVLDLHDKYAIKVALDKARIYPSDNKISTSDVIDAITDYYGVVPILHCSSGGGNAYLLEVFLAVTQDFRVVNSTEVCQDYSCTPSATLDSRVFCGDTLIYTVPRHISPKPEEHCGPKNLCLPKSGTCDADGQGRGSQQDSLVVLGAS